MAFFALHKVAKNIGGDHLPVVISERLDESDEVNEQFKPDYIYCGQTLPQNIREDIGYIVDANDWKEGTPNIYPAFNYQQMMELHYTKAELKFLFLPYMALNREVIAALKVHPEVVLIAQSNHIHKIFEMVEHREIRIAAMPDADERHVDLAVGENRGLGDVEGRASAGPEQ